MNSSSFPLIIITPEEITSQHISLWLPLLKSGADYLYMRGKEVTPTIEEALKDLQSQGFASKLILTQSISKNTSLVPSFRHVKEWERLNQVQEYAQGVPASTSIHNLSELITLDPAYEMVFYSPLFNSISKEGYGPKADLSIIQKELHTLKSQYNHLPQVIGLGGITADNIKQVKQAGFNGAALLGSVWQSPDPVNALKSIKSALEN